MASYLRLTESSATRRAKAARSGKEDEAAVKFSPAAGSLAGARVPGLLVPALLALASMGQIEIAISPFALGMMIDRFHVAQSVGIFTISAQLGTLALGAFLVSIWLEKLPLALMGRVSMTTVLVGQLVSMTTHYFAVLAFAQVVVGAGEGVCVGIAYALMSRTVNASRLITYQGMIMQSVSVGILLLIPEAVAASGPGGVFVPAVIITLFSLPLTLGIPSSCRDDLSVRSGYKTSLPAIVTYSLIAGLISAASNTFWLLLEEIGIHVGLSLAQVSHINAASAITCVAAPHLAYFAIRRFGGLRPILAVCIVQAVLGWLFTHTGSAAVYAVASFGLNITYAFSMVAVRAVSAADDPSGRATASVGGAESAGMVIGPTLAGFVTWIWSGFGSVGTLGVLIFFLAAVPLAFRRNRMDVRVA